MLPSDSFYLSKYGDGTPRLTADIRSEVGLIVTIPCHNEPHVDRVLADLYSCITPACEVEVIVMINASGHAPNGVLESNAHSLQQVLRAQQNAPDWLHIYPLVDNNLPPKHAGVGLARKYAMDEASWRFEFAQRNDGVIVCLDADCRIPPNYLVEVFNHFREHPKTPGCSIWYEHPLDGLDYDRAVYEGIIQYEMHLRYYVLQQQRLHLPYAYQTVGSSMAVRWQDYQREGGMNRRKAGEDFYFLHKIIARGNFTNLRSTCVMPSPRQSDRVPFGTGRAIMEYLETAGSGMLTYNPRSFQDLALWLINPREVEGSTLPESVRTFLELSEWHKAKCEIASNTSSADQFNKRFYRWFNAFKLMKYLHHARDHYHPDVPVVDAAKAFLYDHKMDPAADSKDLLEQLRQVESGVSGF
ncbi:MAG: glycosyltransferase family 2 protein [Flavobacteriales bacterium]|nr:glycosyltransferase family 2 protein [Flavobacteriales bacterium]